MGTLPKGSIREGAGERIAWFSKCKKNERRELTLGFVGWLSSAAATATAVSTLGRLVTCVTAGAVELGNGERHRSEEGAGVVTVRRGGTLLVRNAVIGRLDEKLGGTLYSDYREDTEGYEKSASVIGGVEATTEGITHNVGDFAAVAAEARRAGAATINDLRAEDYRLDGFYYGVRCIRSHVVGVTDGAVIILGGR